jgi:Fe-S-cluster-containing hydrogenase component 2
MCGKKDKLMSDLAVKPIKKAVNNLRILVDLERCYGCRICELICSFHKAEVFSHDLSSIQVSVNNRTGEIKWFVDYSSCDLCEGEEELLCIKYCPYHCLEMELVG